MAQTALFLFACSKGAKIKEVRNAMCEKMGLNVDDVRMWDYHNDTKLKILEDPLCNEQKTEMCSFF